MTTLAVGGSDLVSQQKLVAESFISDKTKTNINLTFNGIAATCNLLTTLNGNLSFLDSAQESIEKLSGFLSKCATAVQGLLNGMIAIEKKNIIALIGGFLELPIAIFTTGYNLFLARGLSAGLNHFDSIISRTKKIKEGKPVLDEKGNPQYYDSFKEEGWVEGFKTTLKHIPKLAKELHDKPFEREGLFPRSFFLCSSLMILGSSVSFAGLTKLGATIRHFFGGLAGIALATDMKKNTNIKQKSQTSNEKSKGFSNFAISGFLWVLAAIPDLFKHFDFFSNRVKNATELALCLDRLAGVFFIFGNQRIGEK
ncbi:MAG: hypothetical protein HY094_08130 [Candidatus Melainabacteria bacterium]|nr:hypothetical protein [Candidatus Melainabacteria bacterium]